MGHYPGTNLIKQLLLIIMRMALRRMLKVIDVKYGEIDVKNNGGWRKRRIYFSEIFTFSRMLRRCAHFPERNCVAEQFLNF